MSKEYYVICIIDSAGGQRVPAAFDFWESRQPSCCWNVIQDTFLRQRDSAGDKEFLLPLTFGVKRALLLLDCDIKFFFETK